MSVKGVTRLAPGHYETSAGYRVTLTEILDAERQEKSE